MDTILRQDCHTVWSIPMAYHLVEERQFYEKGNYESQKCTKTAATTAMQKEGWESQTADNQYD